MLPLFFVNFLLFPFIRIHSIDSSVAIAELHSIYYCCPLSRGLPLGYWAENRTRDCLTAAPCNTVYVTPWNILIMYLFMDYCIPFLFQSKKNTVTKWHSWALASRDATSIYTSGIWHFNLVPEHSSTRLGPLILALRWHFSIQIPHWPYAGLSGILALKKTGQRHYTLLIVERKIHRACPHCKQQRGRHPAYIVGRDTACMSILL